MDKTKYVMDNGFFVLTLMLVFLVALLGSLLLSLLAVYFVMVLVF